jgi:hypothetical protein
MIAAPTVDHRATFAHQFRISPASMLIDNIFDGCQTPKRDGEFYGQIFNPSSGASS